MGECGRSEIEAARTTFAELRALTEAHEQRERREWERTRWAVWNEYRLSPYIKAGNKPRTPKALVRFPWEDEDTIPREQIIGGAVTEYETMELDRIFELLKKKNSNG